MTAALKLVSPGGGGFGGRQQGIRRKASKPRHQMKRSGDGATSEPPELEIKPNHEPPAGRGYGSGGDVSWKEIGPYAASFGMGVRGRRFSGLLSLVG